MMMMICSIQLRPRLKPACSVGYGVWRLQDRKFC